MGIVEDKQLAEIHEILNQQNLTAEAALKRIRDVLYGEPDEEPDDEEDDEEK